MQDAHELPRVSQLFPFDQGYIIKELLAGSYNILPGGVCFGLTQMLIAEALAKNGGLEKYLQRLAKILYFIQTYGGIENYIERQESIKTRAKSENDVTTLSLINENLVEIQAFFEGVVLYQIPAFHPALFISDDEAEQKQLSQSKYPAKTLLTPVNMENRGETVVASAPYIGFYTLDSFAEFIEKIKTHFNNTAFCIEINTKNHQNAIVFDPDIGRLVFVDSNTYPLIWEKSDVAQQVFNTLSNPNDCLLSLRVCVNSKYSESLDAFCAKEIQPSVEETVSYLNENSEILCFITHHLRAGNINTITAIEAVLADITILTNIKHINIVQKNKIIREMLNISIAYDFLPALPILLPLITKPEKLGTPTKPKNFTQSITDKYARCLSYGAIKCAQYFLDCYPNLKNRNDALFLARNDPLSIEFVLKLFNGNKQTEKAALSYKTPEGNDVLFLSVSNSAVFAILLKKYTEFPELISKKRSLSILQELIKHPRSLGIFLEAATTNVKLKQTVLDALVQVIPGPGPYYITTIIHQALRYPASFRALLAFSAERHHFTGLAHLKDSAKYATPYFYSRPGSRRPDSANHLIELFLSNRSMMRFILNLYPLKHQLELLSLRINERGSEIFLFESDFFSEEFKRKVSAHLELKDRTLNKLPPLSLDNMYQADIVDVPQEFVCLFENALSNPDKFNELISSIPAEILAERVSYAIDGERCLLRRSFSSIECFEQLFIQIKDVLPDRLNFELLIACLKMPENLNIYLKHISPEKLFQLISDKFTPYSLMQNYPNAFHPIWTKVYSRPTVPVATRGFFGVAPVNNGDEQAVNKQDSPKNPGKV